MKAAEDADAAMQAELDAQAGKFPLLRSYKVAGEKAAAARQAAEQAQASAQQGKKRAKQQATAAIQEGQTWLTDTMAMLAKAPRAKGSAADIDALKTDLEGAGASLTEAQTLLTTESYKDALEKAMEARASINGVRTQIEVAVPSLNRVVVHVFYATDRNPNSGVFGNGRSGLTYGACDVCVPRAPARRTGELDTPLWRRLLESRPSERVALLRIVTQSKQDFFGDVVSSVRGSKEESALLFVHGFNVTFDDAARRTAQISYDLEFDGASVFFSWPSRGNVRDYTVDEQSVEWAETDLRAFLQEFLAWSQTRRFFVIAHSMGCGALSRAIASVLADDRSLRLRITEVILAAPDIDADVFRRQIAPALAASGCTTTLYASSDDRALLVSKKIHGSPRAGDAGQGLIVTRGVETIDATGVETSFLGHGYFASNRSVLGDMYYLIRGRRADERFSLRSVDTAAGRYWVFE